MSGIFSDLRSGEDGQKRLGEAAVFPSKRPPRVAVITTDPGLSFQAEGPLGRASAEVILVDTPDRLREVLNRPPCDLLLLDCPPPSPVQVDWLDVIDSVSGLEELPIVILAETDDLHRVVDRTSRRFHAVILTRPVDPGQLNSAIESGLRDRSRQLENRDLLLRLSEANAELDRQRQHAVDEARRKTRFLAAISHEIRTPINAMILSAQLLQILVRDQEVDSEDLTDLTDNLQGSAKSLIEMLDDLLDITRFDQGSLTFSSIDFPLGSFLHQVIREIQPVAERKGLPIVETSRTPNAIIRSDSTQLGRVISNLLSNAVKFTSRGEVEVESWASKSEGFVIRVRDTGIGIPPELRDGIFDEFTQLRNPERDRSKGSGLGLAICRRLMDGMGGSIRLLDGHAHGSTFEIRLPAEAVTADDRSAGPALRPDSAASPLKNGEAARVMDGLAG